MSDKAQESLSGTAHGAAIGVGQLRIRMEQAGRILAGEVFHCPTCEANIRRIVDLERVLGDRLDYCGHVILVKWDHPEPTIALFTDIEEANKFISQNVSGNGSYSLQRVRVAK